MVCQVRRWTSFPSSVGRFSKLCSQRLHRRPGVRENVLSLDPAGIFEGQTLLFVRTKTEVNQILADLKRDITRLRQESPLPVQRDG